MYLITVFILNNVKIDASMRDKAYSSLRGNKSTDGLILSLLVLGAVLSDIVFRVQNETS
jgi:hypothetical protein